MNPCISVLMGIYNAEDTVGKAIESIQKQTYGNWQLICCEDGSTDHSFDVLRSYAEEDKRIVLFRNARNMGLGYTLNRCFERAAGEYIARMDADDESLPERFEEEVRVLENGDYSLVSCGIIMYDGEKDISVRIPKEKPDVTDLIKGSPIIHPACMMNRKCLEQVGGYSESSHTLRAEDTDLWFRLYRAGYTCYNLQKPLYRYRYDYDLLRRQELRYRYNSTLARWKGCRVFKEPPIYYLLAARPILVGLIPPSIRYVLRRGTKRQTT